VSEREGKGAERRARGGRGKRGSASHCTTLHHATPGCTTQCHTVTHCNTLQHAATNHNTLRADLKPGKKHCNTLQYTATRCNTHTATNCNITIYRHGKSKLSRNRIVN